MKRRAQQISFPEFGLPPLIAWKRYLKTRNKIEISKFYGNKGLPQKPSTLAMEEFPWEDKVLFRYPEEESENLKMPLSGKRILIGRSGGLQAYKVAHLIRLLIKIQSRSPKSSWRLLLWTLLPPSTLSTLSKNQLFLLIFFDKKNRWVEQSCGIGKLGRPDDHCAGFVCQYPGKNGPHGQSDNLLCCTYLSCTCPGACRTCHGPGHVPACRSPDQSGYP